MFDCSQIALDEHGERPQYERQLPVSEDISVKENFNTEEIIEKLVKLSEGAEQETQELEHSPEIVTLMQTLPLNLKKLNEKRKKLELLPQDITRVMQTLPLNFKTS